MNRHSFTGIRRRNSAIEEESEEQKAQDSENGRQTFSPHVKVKDKEEQNNGGKTQTVRTIHTPSDLERHQHYLCTHSGRQKRSC